MMPTDKGHEAADRELKKLEASLKKMYKEAANDMKKKAEEFMRDFERKDNDMKKLVEAGKLTEEKYMTWRRNQMMTEERIQDMKEQLTQDLVHADQIAAAMINETLPQAYAENMNFGTYEIEHGTEINTSFTLYDKKTVENLMKKDPKIIPQARVSIPEDERWNRQKLTSAIAQGILQGESIPRIADRLQTVAAMDRNAAIRNARTYTTAAENKGRVDSIERANEMGIPADQEWIATLDDRTRMEHRHLDGQVRPVGDPFSADGYRIMYPGDPDAEPEMIYNCRCTLVSKVRGRIYNDERNESKLDGMSYEEWKHAKDRQIKPEETQEELTTGRDEFGMRRENGDEISNEEKIAIIQEDLECTEELAEEIREALDLWTEEGGEFKTAQIMEEKSGRSYGKYTEYAHLTELYIHDAPSYTGEMYRGLNFESKEEAEKVLELARENDPKAFNIDHTTTSWTADKSVVEDIYGYGDTYEDGAAVIFVADEGHTESTSISHFENGGLAEVLVSRDAAWEYVSDERDGNTIIIHVREAQEATREEKPAATYKTFSDMPDTKTETIGRYVRDGEVIKEGHEVEYATTYKGDGSAISEYFGKISNNKELIDEMSQEEQKAFKQMWSKGKLMHGQQYGGFENMKPKEKEATRTFDKYLDRATLSEGIEVVRISDAQLLLGAGNKEANLEAIAKMEGERITCGANMSFSAAAEGLRILPTGPAPTVEYTLKIEEGTTGAGMYIGDNRINIWGDKQREFMTNRDIWMTVGKSEVDEARGITKVELIFGGLMEHEYK